MPTSASEPSTESAKIEYQHGKPTLKGIYACRVPIYTNDGRPISRIVREDGESRAEHLCEDVFLQWQDNQWYHYGSSEKFRLEVPYFLGPLPRVHV